MNQVFFYVAKEKFVGFSFLYENEELYIHWNTNFFPKSQLKLGVAYQTNQHIAGTFNPEISYKFLVINRVILKAFRLQEVIEVQSHLT
jgi:hypothetical protein